MFHKNDSSTKSKIVKDMLLTLYAAGVLLTAPIQSSAGEGPPGLPFLRIAMDARGSARAGAMTASGTGLASLHWNPAGLAGGYDQEVLFSHLRGIENTDSEFIAMLFKKGEKNTFAISVFSNTIDRYRTTLSAEPYSERDHWRKRFLCGTFLRLRREWSTAYRRICQISFPKDIFQFGKWVCRRSGYQVSYAGKKSYLRHRTEKCRRHGSIYLGKADNAYAAQRRRCLHNSTVFPLRVLPDGIRRI